MAKYRVLEKSFIDNRICEEGSEVDYDFGKDKDGNAIEPGPHLVLVDDGSKKTAKAAAVDAAS